MVGAVLADCSSLRPTSDSAVGQLSEALQGTLAAQAAAAVLDLQQQQLLLHDHLIKLPQGSPTLAGVLLAACAAY